MLDALQIGNERLGICGGKRKRLRHLDLKAVTTVIDPGAGDENALALLEVDERPHQDHGVTGRVLRVEHGPTGRVAGVTHPANGHFPLEGLGVLGGRHSGGT